MFIYIEREGLRFREVGFTGLRFRVDDVLMGRLPGLRACGFVLKEGMGLFSEFGALKP